MRANQINDDIDGRREGGRVDNKVVLYVIIKNDSLPNLEKDIQCSPNECKKALRNIAMEINSCIPA